MPFNNTKNPRSSKLIPNSLSFDLTIRLVVRAVRASRFGIVNINRQTGTILAKKNWSLKSWGEHILITVMAKGNDSLVQIVMAGHIGFEIVKSAIETQLE